MEEYLILIIEDDEDTIASWQRDINDFNEANEGHLKYEPHFATSRQSALKALKQLHINCAVIDLRLPLSETDTNPPTNDSGNDILQKLLVDIGVPAIVYSGHIAEVSDLVKNSNIKTMTKKGNGAAEILNIFASQKDLISAMHITKTKIAQESAKIFNDSIWNRWEKSWQAMSDKNVLAGMISRQIASHVSDRLSLPPANHHPDEFYIIPPLFKDRLDTGDLIEIGEEVYVVVTPRCNMANSPFPKHFILAHCRKMDAAWTELKTGFNDTAAKGRERATKKLRDYAVQNHSTSSHFIPPCEEKGPWLVDFAETHGISSTEIPTLISKRFASISTHFIPNLIQRYAAYLGRIGQPDLDWEILKTDICK